MSGTKKVNSISPPAEPISQMVGRKVGKYLILRLIGQGGMGLVFEAEDELLKRRVALKFLPEAAKRHARAVERFFVEAQAAARLSHPNVIAIYDIGQFQDSFFIVMELLNPLSTAGYIRQKGPLHWVEATKVLAECCTALQAAHQAGLVHRDIKPDNILCSPSGITKIADFGLVKDQEPGAPGLTQSGALAGTPTYMSPEQCKGHPLDGRSDLYSLGATYYTLLTGQLPYSAEHPPEIMLMHIADPTPEPRLIVPDIPEACVQILNCAMQKDRAQRYQTAGEMRSALDAVLLGAPAVPFGFLAPSESSQSRQTGPLGKIEAPPAAMSPATDNLQETTSSKEATGEPSPRWPPRRLGALAAAALGMALTALGVLFLTHRVAKNEKPPQAGLPSEAIRVGIIHAMAGPLAANERAILDATLIAIEELNGRGGLLGRRIEPLVADGTTDPENTARVAQELITRDRVAVVFGGWSSRARKAMKEVFEKQDHLLVYPRNYEGLEDSPNILYTGAVPSQYIVPALRYCSQARRARKYFLIGLDTVSSRVISEVMRDEIQALEGTVVGERYALLGDVYFASLIKKIRHTKPDLIVSSLQGDTSAAFFRALAAAGLSADKLPVLSISLDQSTLAAASELDMSGHYLAGSYFHEGEVSDSDSLSAALAAKHAMTQIPTDNMIAAYSGVALWAQAVQTASSIDPKAVRLALHGQTFHAPGGVVRVSASSNHLWKTFRLARFGKENRIEVVTSSSQPFEPIVFPPGRRRSDWENLLARLHGDWGNQWSNPQKPRLLR